MSKHILISAAVLFSALAFAQTSVPTYHNDSARTGQYLTETLLTPANVQSASFGKRFTYAVDGTVYAQPLYVPRVNIAGQGLHNVVYVATAHNSIYAFDADDPTATAGAPLWKVNFLDSTGGVTSVPVADVNCPVIAPELGIVGTPVIDTSAGTLYAIVETKESGPNYVFRIHAIDITSGAERAGSPATFQYAGFIPLDYKQRGALLLSNGVIYSGWSSNCDHGSYHGYIFAHDAATLNQIGVYNATPSGNAASFWNAGAGPSADSDGNIFVVSANGDFDAASGGLNYGDSVIKLNPAKMTVTDFFTPYNQSALDVADLDLGSSGALILPDSAGSADHPHLLLTAGKEGRLYLLDRDHLGGAQFSSDYGALASLNVLSNAAFGMTSYFNGAIYVASEKSPLRSYTMAGATLGSTPLAQTSFVASNLGATPSISANGKQNGIVWMVPNDGTLRAYDAASLSPLYSSGSQANDNLGGYTEFMVPTVANGKVYAGAQGALAVYGELPPGTPVLKGIANAASYSTEAVAPGSLVALFGSGLALQTAAVTSLPLPISWGDVTVTFNGVAAPLLFISPGQINAQVPLATAAGDCQVVVSVAGAASQAATVMVAPAATGIFADNDTASAINQDGSINGAAHPAPPGSVVSVYFTGGVSVGTGVPDGAPAPSEAVNQLSQNISATIGGSGATISFAGAAPGFVGLNQLNVTIPSITAGSYPLVIEVGGQASNSASLFIGSN